MSFVSGCEMFSAANVLLLDAHGKADKTSENTRLADEKFACCQNECEHLPIFPECTTNLNPSDNFLVNIFILIIIIKEKPHICKRARFATAVAHSFGLETRAPTMTTPYTSKHVTICEKI